MAVQLIHEEPDRWSELQVGDSPTHVAFTVAEAYELLSVERSLREIGGRGVRAGLSVWTEQSLRNLDSLRDRKAKDPGEARLDEAWITDLRRRGMDVE